MKNIILVFMLMAILTGVNFTPSWHLNLSSCLYEMPMNAMMETDQQKHSYSVEKVLNKNIKSIMKMLNGKV